MKSHLLPISLACISSFLGAFGQLQLKLGANRLTRSISAVFKNSNLIVGILLYILAAGIFIFALKREKLTVLYPLVATSYIWTSLLAKKYLNEKMNLFKWTGVALILIGVSLIV
jgi:drug/metabolite transporter (DMT)-like permease